MRLGFLGSPTLRRAGARRARGRRPRRRARRHPARPAPRARRARSSPTPVKAAARAARPRGHRRPSRRPRVDRRRPRRRRRLRRDRARRASSTRVPMLNVHFSLLPRWRGAAPVERAILAGDERDRRLRHGPRADARHRPGLRARRDRRRRQGPRRAARRARRARRRRCSSSMLAGGLAGLPGARRRSVGEATYAHEGDRRRARARLHEARRSRSRASCGSGRARTTRRRGAGSACASAPRSSTTRRRRRARFDGDGRHVRARRAPARRRVVPEGRRAMAPLAWRRAGVRDGAADAPRRRAAATRRLGTWRGSRTGRSGTLADRPVDPVG